MKKFIAILMICATLLACTACNYGARMFGGSMTMELPANQKLEFVTWKDDADLWILTKPMTADDVAETYIFQESSNLGILEGTVTIVETKE